MFIGEDASSISVAGRWQRPDPHLRELFATAPAAVVGDALGRMLVMDAGIRCMTSTATRMVGFALPVVVRAGDNLAIHRALDEAEPGDVLVVNGAGDLSRALIGDLIGEIMMVRGVPGAVVDGAVRDVDVLDANGLAVFARGTTPAGPFKTGPGWVGRPVAAGGVVVGPGDVVVADSDGVAVVPLERSAWAVAQMEIVLGREAELRRRITMSAEGET
ncbi:RraA family protein [Pseudonocardia ailaonensis]|uniref:Putative 4-hydroxy-4-methyl-2-oxoglutarate aldolase n=1 Tax=Pseudonocardia ailaonensis TaxID=367279 RepID=A0ABN2NJ75_9PSEU